MKAPKEYKNWINNLKHRSCKSNGILSLFCLDYPEMDIKLANSKKNYKRSKLWLKC